jgi:hypothetical protein
MNIPPHIVRPYLGIIGLVCSRALLLRAVLVLPGPSAVVHMGLLQATILSSTVA